MRSRSLAVAAAAILLAFGLYLLLLKPAGTRRALPRGPSAPQVSLGESHGLVIASDGTLWSWGEAAMGWPVLGLGSTAVGLTQCTRTGR